MCLIHNTPPVAVNLKKMRRLMKKHGLRCPIRRAIPCHKIKDTMKTYNYAPSFLDREFEYYGPRFVLLTDITHIPWEDHSSTTVEIFKILNFHPFSLKVLKTNFDSTFFAIRAKINLESGSKRKITDRITETKMTCNNRTEKEFGQVRRTDVALVRSCLTLTKSKRVSGGNDNPRAGG